MASPYDNLPDQAFWRSAFGHPDALAGLYAPKFKLTRETPIMTAGSCFAQHIHRALVRDDWNVLQAEDMSDFLPSDLGHLYGYNLSSARYGNIYTARQFRQLVRAALSNTPSPVLVWEKEGRYVDALRPSVEPDGLDHPDHVRQARAEHLAAVRGILEGAETIIFTLGLTEAWIDSATGMALPTAPGIVAGTYDPDEVVFHNFTHSEILTDLLATRDLLQTYGLPIRIVLTVSPVPLSATATGQHVGQASAYSKSVLRAVCGQLNTQSDDFDYFPSYEIITTPVAGGPFFTEDMRQPSGEGITAAISVFTTAHADDAPRATIQPTSQAELDDDRVDEVICEEILLEAFRP